MILSYPTHWQTLGPLVIVGVGSDEGKSQTFISVTSLGVIDSVNPLAESDSARKHIPVAQQSPSRMNEHTYIHTYP